MSNETREYRGRVVEQPSAVSIGVGGDPVFVAKGDAKDGIHMKSYDVATAMQEVAFDQLNKIDSWKRLNLRMESISSPLALHTKTALFADSTNRLERDQKVLAAVEFLDSDEEAAELADDLSFINEKRSQMDDGDARGEVLRRIYKWASNPSTGLVFEESAATARTATVERLREQIEIDLTPAFETAIEVRQNASIAAWVDGGRRRLSDTQNAIQNDAAQLRRDLEPTLPLHLALWTYLANSKIKAGRLHILFVPDVQGAFAESTPTLLEKIQNLQLSFVDVIPTEAMSEAAAGTFIDALGTDVHGALYLPFMQYSNVQQLRRNIPKRQATNAAGNVHMTPGRGTIGQFENIPMSPSDAGLRRRIDGLVGAKSYGYFEPTCGRKGPKDLVGFDHVDSWEWPIQTAMDLATESGGNSFIYNPTSNVPTLALDRSRSSLESKTQFAANRSLQILLGAIRQSLSVEMVTTYDDPEVIREHLRLTDERFLKPYRHTPGFEAKITHSGSLAPGLVGLQLKYSVNSPIESFVIEVDSNRD